MNDQIIDLINSYANEHLDLKKNICHDRNYRNGRDSESAKKIQQH